MATYRVCITDITCYGTLYCVAGWDIDNGCMVRPEPAGANLSSESSRFWDARFVGSGNIFEAGNVVQIDASTPPRTFPYPHATEDRIAVAGSPLMTLKRLTQSQLLQAVGASVSPTLNDAFEGNLVRAHSGKAYVRSDTRTKSLGAIEIEPGDITFLEETTSTGKRRLRALIDSGGSNYSLSVPADLARTRFLRAGVSALQADAAASSAIHVRVGLCRPFSEMPDACYAQVNGLYFL